MCVRVRLIVFCLVPIAYKIALYLLWLVAFEAAAAIVRRDREAFVYLCECPKGQVVPRHSHSSAVNGQQEVMQLSDFPTIANIPIHRVCSQIIIKLYLCTVYIQSLVSVRKVRLQYIVKLISVYLATLSFVLKKCFIFPRFFIQIPYILGIVKVVGYYPVKFYVHSPRLIFIETSHTTCYFMAPFYNNLCLATGSY